MKVESVSQIFVPTSTAEDFPIINAEEIKSILSLGIRGNIKPETDEKNTKNTVDIFA
jgi:hypothetical protein